MRDIGDLEHRLAVGDLDGQMRGDGVGELGGSSICETAATISGEIFLLSFT
jgi:hypothetical protein